MLSLIPRSTITPLSTDYLIHPLYRLYCDGAHCPLYFAHGFATLPTLYVRSLPAGGPTAPDKIEYHHCYNFTQTRRHTRRSGHPSDLSSPRNRHIRGTRESPSPLLVTTVFPRGWQHCFESHINAPALPTRRPAAAARKPAHPRRSALKSARSFSITRAFLSERFSPILRPQHQRFR